MISIGVVIFVLGAIVGSFLNVVIIRTYLEESLLGRSHCNSCKKLIAWYDNIPIISYILLRGSCRHCNDRFSFQYPAVECTTGLLFLLAYFSLEPLATTITIITLFSYFVFISFLIVIFVYDLKWYLILDVVTIPAIIFAFLVNSYLGMEWWNLLLAGIIGGGFFLLQFVISRGKWIGGGDIRLGFLMGVMLGFPMVLIALTLAYLIGTLISLPLVFIGSRTMSDKIPFGTFLSIATVMSLLWGEQMLVWYLNFLHL